MDRRAQNKHQKEIRRQAIRRFRKVKAYGDREHGRKGGKSPTWIQGTRGGEVFPARPTRPMKNQYRWNPEKGCTVKV